MRGREARRRREDALATGVVAGVTALTAIGSRISSDYDSAEALLAPELASQYDVDTLRTKWETLQGKVGKVTTSLFDDYKVSSIRNADAGHHRVG